MLLIRPSFQNLISLGLADHIAITLLANRTTIIHTGSDQLPSYALGSYGTPQGSVLLPFPFNVSMMTLAWALRSIPDLKFSLYPNDIALCMTGGSDGEIQETLRAVASTVVALAGSMNLPCFSLKSELLLPSH